MKILLVLSQMVMDIKRVDLSPWSWYPVYAID